MADGVRNRKPEAENYASAVPKKVTKFDNNKYNSRKTLAKGLLDVALLPNNLSNLKQLIKHQGTDRQHPLFEWMVGGLIISVCLQVFSELRLLGQHDCVFSVHLFL